MDTILTSMVTDPCSWCFPWKGSSVQFSSVQFSRSVVSDSATLWTVARQASLSITNSQSLLKLMSVMSQ